MGRLLKLGRSVPVFQGGPSRTGGESAHIWIHTGRYSAFDIDGDNSSRRASDRPKINYHQVEIFPCDIAKLFMYNVNVKIRPCECGPCECASFQRTFPGPINPISLPTKELASHSPGRRGNRWPGRRIRHSAGLSGRLSIRFGAQGWFQQT
jgi:hypothetical protein